MLSRVAERTYWFGRYMERIESTARLMTVNTQLLLDLPRSVRLGWSTLVEITGIHEPFFERFQNADERNIVRFLLADRECGSSIRGALALARENGRTTREIMPAEAWELVNDLYLFVEDHAEGAVARGSRDGFLIEVIERCQQLTGLIEGSLAHNNTRDFIIIGRSLERADMSTRIIDVGSGNFLALHGDRRSREELETPEPFDNILWMSVLRSLSAFQMYRQHVRERVNGEDVVAFLLQNGLHPRSVVRSLARLDRYLENLPNSDRARGTVSLAQRQVWETDMKLLFGDSLHELIDELQLAFAGVHQAIAETWFLSQHR